MRAQHRVGKERSRWRTRPRRSATAECGPPLPSGRARGSRVHPYSGKAIIWRWPCRLIRRDGPFLPVLLIQPADVECGGHGDLGAQAGFPAFRRIPAPLHRCRWCCRYARRCVHQLGSAMAARAMHPEMDIAICATGPQSPTSMDWSVEEGGRHGREANKGNKGNKGNWGDDSAQRIHQASEVLTGGRRGVARSLWFRHWTLSFVTPEQGLTVQFTLQRLVLVLILVLLGPELPAQSGAGDASTRTRIGSWKG